jgi:hypothetical protein
MPNISRRTSAYAGLLLGPLWIAIVIMVTWLEWDFLRSLGWALVDNHEVPYPSATARGDVGFLQMLNFALLGLLGGIFAVGFRREFRHRISGYVATAGFGLFMAGALLNIAPTDLPGEPSTWHGVTHDVGFLMVLLSTVIAFSASGLALRGNPDWRRWRLLGWTPVALFAIAATGAGLPGDLGFYLFLVIALGWYAIMGGRLLMLDRAQGSRRATARVPDAAAPGLL